MSRHPTLHTHLCPHFSRSLSLSLSLSLSHTHTHTHKTQTQNAAAPEKSSTTLDRTEQLYARGKEKGQRVLQKDIASRPPRAKRPEEECSFHPRTNWRKNAQEGDKGVPAFPPSTQK